MLSFATGRILVSLTSGETSLMSTVPTHEPTGLEIEASDELPGVVQWQPEATESINSSGSNEGDATSTADESGEADLEPAASNGVGQIARETRVVMLLVLCVLILLILLI